MPYFILSRPTIIPAALTLNSSPKITAHPFPPPHLDTLPKLSMCLSAFCTRRPAVMPMVVGREAAHTPSRFNVRSSMPARARQGSNIIYCSQCHRAASLPHLDRSESECMPNLCHLIAPSTPQLEGASSQRGSQVQRTQQSLLLHASCLRAQGSWAPRRSKSSRTARLACTGSRQA